MNFREAIGKMVDLYRAMRDMDRFTRDVANHPRQRAVIRYIETFPPSMRVWVANRMCERASRDGNPYPPSPYQTKYIPGKRDESEVTVVDLETWCD